MKIIACLFFTFVLLGCDPNERPLPSGLSYTVWARLGEPSLLCPLGFNLSKSKEFWPPSRGSGAHMGVER